MADDQSTPADKSAEMTDENGKGLSDAVLESPMLTLAVVAGVAFAIGALWKASASRQQPRYDRLVARLGELRDQVPRPWR